MVEWDDERERRINEKVRKLQEMAAQRLVEERAAVRRIVFEVLDPRPEVERLPERPEVPEVFRD